MPKSSWTAADDEALIALVQEYTLQSTGKPHASLWKRVAERLGQQRTPAVCRGRWSLFNPHVVQSDWTEAEDLALIESIKAKPVASIGWSRRAAELATVHRYGGARRRLGQDVCRRWVKVLAPRGGPLLAPGPHAGEHVLEHALAHPAPAPLGRKGYACCVARRVGGARGERCIANALLVCAPALVCAPVWETEQRCANAANMHSESVIYMPPAVAMHSR